MGTVYREICTKPLPNDSGRRKLRMSVRILRVVVAILIVIAAILGGAAFSLRTWHHHHYPFGAYHRCDKQLWFALREYAEKHGGKFPSGEATPEASLGLLGREYAYLLPRRSIRPEVVEQMMNRGQLLDPQTCGWHYVEGLRLDSNPKLALFWDKEGLDEIGGRLPAGGHFVSYIEQPYNYIPESRWNNFLEEQKRLLIEEKAKAARQWGKAGAGKD